MPCVYALSSSNDPDKYRYVGISRHDNPDKRLKNHLVSSKSLKYKYSYLPVYKWIRKEVSAGNQILATTLDTSSDWDQVCLLEIEYIKQFKDKNYNLLNMTKGGEGVLGHKPSEETKSKIKEFWTEEKREWQRQNTLNRGPYKFTDLDKESCKEAAKKVHSERRQKGIVWGKDIGPKNKTPSFVREKIIVMKSQGLSLRAIATALNNEGVPAPSGGMWYHSTVSNILKYVKGEGEGEDA